MRVRVIVGIRLIAVMALVSPAMGAQPPGSEQIELRLDTSEAEAALAILAKHAAGQPVSEADWRRLFTSVPYTRLRKREASMHRDFTDAEFKAFLLAPEMTRSAADLERTLREWKKADLTASARRVLAYLPSRARIHSAVYPVIKPKTNSFVFESSTNPAIFLYIDPRVTTAQFENTVAHELHHIGFSSVEPAGSAELKDLPSGVQEALTWMGAFGEGFAMLAAAGGPDVHPHAVSSPEDRARWDKDMGNFDRDLESVESFFLDVVRGRLKTPDEIQAAGSSFFGVQGPWYTVGYTMAVAIERRFGRATLIDCMLDPRRLLARYNEAAAELNKTNSGPLALWSDELLESLGSTALPETRASAGSAGKTKN